MFRFPWTNEHELNLSWVIRMVKEMEKTVKNVVTSVNGAHGDVILPIPDAFNGTPAALGTAAPGSSASYARGDHVHQKPTYTASDVGAVPEPSVAGSNGDVLALDASLNPVWTAPGGGSGPDPYDSTPAALGTASPGVSDDYARGDHVHQKPSASDVGAIAAPVGPTSGQYLQWNGNDWIAASLPVYNGG